MKYYTGVGARAHGADQAFEAGSTKSEIYLPWLGFEGHESKLTYTNEARVMTAEFHPNWNHLTSGVRSLMARHAHQVLGQDLKTPSDFLICWTKGGRMFGGTAQALRIANRYDIKVYNLGNETVFKFWLNLVSELQMNLF